VLALLALTIGWLAWSRVRTSGTAEALLRHAPANAQIFAFLDVALMRQTGVLERIAGARGVEEQDYTRFVEQSGFDYRKHLDAVVMAKRGDAQYAVIAGRFDGARLQRYAVANAGRCTADYCYVPGTRPVSFAPIREGLYAFASGTGDARELLTAHAPGVRGEFLGAPVWAAGLGPEEIPLLGQLSGAQTLSLWLTPRLPAAVELQFSLEMKDPLSAAKTARDLGTLARAGDLAKYLSGAQVEAEGHRVSGRLPLPLELLESLVNGTRAR